MTAHYLKLLFFFLVMTAAMALAEETTPVPYSISDCARLGIDNSFKLKTYDSKAAQNRAKVHEVLDANNPDVGITGSSTYQKPEVLIGFPSMPGMPSVQGVVMPEWYHTYSLSITKLITSFGKVESAARLTEISVEQTYMQKRIDEESFLYQVVRGFYALLLSEQLLSIEDSQVKTWEDQHTISTSLYDRGVVAKYDLLRVQVSLAQARDIRQTALKNMNVARGNLRTLMGLPADEKVTVSIDSSFWKEKEQERMALPLKRWKEIAEESQPSLKLAGLAVKQGFYALELARLDMAPSVSFATSYGRQTQTFTGSDWNWKNSVALNIPLMDGGEKSDKEKQAREMITQADLNLKDTERTALWNVENAWLDLQSLFPKLKIAEEQVITAQEGRRVAQVRYREGLSTIVEVTDAQTALVRAQVSYQTTLFNYYAQMANLSYTAGIVKDDIFSEEKKKK